MFFWMFFLRFFLVFLVFFQGFLKQKLHHSSKSNLLGNSLSVSRVLWKNQGSGSL